MKYLGLVLFLIPTLAFAAKPDPMKFKFVLTMTETRAVLALDPSHSNTISAAAASELLNDIQTQYTAQMRPNVKK